jgi:hypothetical protein
MDGLSSVQEKSRSSGGCEGCCDFAGDVACFAQAAHHNTSGAAQDESDGFSEALV